MNKPLFTAYFTARRIYYNSRVNEKHTVSNAIRKALYQVASREHHRRRFKSKTTKRVVTVWRLY